jgi:hypothetical protein
VHRKEIPQHEAVQGAHRAQRRQDAQGAPPTRRLPHADRKRQEEQAAETEQRHDEPARGSVDREQLAHGLAAEAVARIEQPGEDVGRWVDDRSEYSTNEQ